MEYSELFSRKFGLRPTPQGLIYDKVPESARVGVFNVVFSLLGTPRQDWGYYRGLYLEICRILRKMLNWTLTYEFEYPKAIETIILTCEWYHFYEICQIVYDYFIKTVSQDFAITKPGIEQVLQEQLNALFRDEFLGFEIQNGKIERIGNPITDAKIKEARYLLKEQEFKGADAHFEKAIKALNERPNPDVENCVKDAVSAIESVGRIITNDENALLSDIIKNAAKKGVIPQPLDQTFQKVYAYRGNEPGVAHGAVDVSKVTEAEAELILAMSAAMIIYLVKKRSQLS